MPTTKQKIIDDIFDAAVFQLSDILPSEWAEQNRFMTSDVSPMEGMFSFDNAPYARFILDCFAPSHPARVIVVMKGAQIGFSTSVLENLIGWIITEHPCNTMLLVGHETLVEKAMKKIDNMIDNSGIREKNLIHATANRANKNKTGDKDRLKEFSGGSLTLGPTNHKSLRQVSIKMMLVDDLEAMKGSSKESGDTMSLIRRRTAAYAKTSKTGLVSTPEVKETSLIEPEYLKGDQQRLFVPCPCCGEFILLEWEIDSEIKENEKAGIYWECDDNGYLKPETVGYICQKCDGFFTDQHKTEMLLSAEAKSTLPDGVPPVDPSYVSFQISNLYAPTYMAGWEYYVREYLEANPIGQPRNEAKHQTFVNTVLGQTYSPQGETINAQALQKNIRPYSPGTIPEKQSIADGNGKIVMVTLGSDMNGTAANEKLKYENDARLDWEIIAWSETGASYSVDHGSIGTFQPANARNESVHNHPDRVKFSYQFGAENCVWDALDLILGTPLKVDTGRRIPIFATGLDTGHLSEYAYPYMENTQYKVYGIKGDKQHDAGIFIDADYRPFQISKENAKLWILNVNRYKDVLATHIGLVWNPHITQKQPANFMNFPTPENGKYEVHNYFSHFEAEHKIVDDKTKRFIWKKIGIQQNHLFDCRIYGMAAKDIIVHEIFKEIPKMKNGTWTDFVNMVIKK